MRQVLRIFFGAEGPKKWMVLGCLLLGNIVQGIGIAGLVPLIAVVSDSGSEEPSAAATYVLDAVRSIGIEPTLEILLLIVVAGISAKSLINLLAMRYVGYVVADISTSLRRELLANLLNANWSFLSQQSLGKVAQTINQMAMRAGQAFKLSADFLSNLLQTAVYIVVGFFVSWKLAVLSLVIGAIITLSLNRFIKQARNAGRDDAGQTNQLGAILADALLGIKSLKAMERQKEYADLINASISKMRKTMRRKVITKEKLANAQEPLLVVCLAGGFYILIEIVQMPIAQLIVMGVILQRTVKTINKLQTQLQQVAIMEGSYEALHSMMNESAAQAEERGGRVRPTLDRGIAFRKVSFHYTDQDGPVLNELSLDFPARQLSVLTGPSGAGKTTVTDILLGFYYPMEGQVLIDGTPLQDLDLIAWRQMIGYVPQELGLFTETILANITLMDPKLTEEMAVDALKAAGAWDFVSQLPDGIHTMVGERGSRFSGGQRQRISIARALVHKPRLLILDEVTSALDATTEQEICQTMKALSQEVTIIAISHRPSWIEVADVVHRLEGGRLANKPDEGPRAVNVS
ncbi:ABC transporter ATP-binding protein [Fodinicurvata sediminis]|uniref:ABC transporter ATP-binding protein n=1 Tax=Fodinicurvata sediminis TaxID=1121832 RepID=UPI0009DBF815|nr:ABC transporter ATP-binding protein [Fodinicurvata sediminis]